MKRNSPLSVALHLLAHLAELGRPVTSEEMAGWLQTNPVVVRRGLAGLREAGLVASVKGHGGGWTLGRAAEKISLLDVYRALHEPLLPHPRRESPGCLVEAAVVDRLAGCFEAVEAQLAERFAQINLADLGRDVASRLEALGHARGAIANAHHH